MRLKKLAIFNKYINILFWLLMLPFATLGLLTDWVVVKPLRWILDELDWLRWMIGNRLLKMSDEVQTGFIKNQSMIKQYTAYAMNERLNAEGRTM